MTVFSREELQELALRAERQAGDVGNGPRKRRLLDLADAAYNLAVLMYVGEINMEGKRHD